MMFTALHTCTHGDVRLVGGETSYEGIVEICFSGSWALVCDYYWNVNESTVVCRQLTGESNPSKRLHNIYMHDMCLLNIVRHNSVELLGDSLNVALV